MIRRYLGYSLPLRRAFILRQDVSTILWGNGPMQPPRFITSALGSPIRRWKVLLGKLVTTLHGCYRRVRNGTDDRKLGDKNCGRRLDTFMKEVSVVPSEVYEEYYRLEKR